LLRNCVSRSLSSLIMKRVALLIETSRSYGRELLLGVRRYVAEHGRWSIFAEIRDLESKPPRWLKDWDGDGILTRTVSQPMVNAIRALKVPTIELRSTKRRQPFPFVGMDNTAIGQLCADYLLNRAYRHFGVYELTTEPFFIERSQSFARRVREAGFACHAYRQSSNREKPIRWEKQQGMLVDWLRALPKPIAILACTDQLGFWLLDACSRAELSVPDEIAVLGVENDETLCELSHPPLSSTRLGGDRVGYAAAAILDRWMDGKKPARKPTLLSPIGIETRRSTDSIAVSDPWLAQAMKLVRDQASTGIRVDDILREIPISRSSLERGFRTILGRSPNDEIHRLKLQRVCELLALTDLTLDEIAVKTSFAHKHYLATCFKKAYHQTPGEYRKQARHEAG
jgi:LacI family transcriptional regulator